MKYNFVYDADFLEKNSLYLTEEERDIVLATVIGKHNAIFYGYKPERLVDAIKKLTSNYPFVATSSPFLIGDKLSESNGGILYMNGFDSWGVIDQQYLYGHTLNDQHRCTQFIATTTSNPLESVVPDVLNNFDIIYMCKEDEKLPYARTQLAIKFYKVLEYHNSLHSGRYVTSTELAVDDYWLFRDAYSYLCNLAKNNPAIARKVSMVSRSVSDCKNNCLTTLEDVHIAEEMCGLRGKVDVSVPTEVNESITLDGEWF